MNKTNASETIFLPDGRYIDLPAASVRRYRCAGDPMPRFEVDGTRYATESCCEFGWLPDDEDGRRVYKLVALEAPPN